MGYGPESFRTVHRRLIEQLYHEVRGEAPGLDQESFATLLGRSVQKAGVPGHNVTAYLRGLRLADLAMAAACVGGSEAAWARFMEKTREPLRAAGRAIGGDRGEELADGLFGGVYAA